MNLSQPIRLLAIDPGNEYSAYVLLDESLRPLFHDKVRNEELLSGIIPVLLEDGVTDLAIEMIASYGMAVGKTVFDTCFWAGRFWEACGGVKNRRGIYRMEEKNNLCHSSRANDSNIRQALIDRFAPNTPNGGKGSKKNPGFFYGFSADQWAAMAAGVTYYDLYLSEERHEP